MASRVVRIFTPMIEKIKQLASQYKDEFISIRHHLHAHPELSYKEYETSAFVQGKLKAMGIDFRNGVAETGVVALIKGKNPGKRIIALRADMDALPIKEENDVDYRSANDGVMHACGHDVHTTCLLGAAKILHQLKEEWEGTVKLIFQPGEEKNPGGASLMIRDGVLENPKPQNIVALHVHPGMEVGQYSFRKGKCMASADELYITIKAKGGHAAAPHLTADTIYAASQLVISLQQIVSRYNNPVNPTVLSITSIQGGHTTNVIPSEVKMMGTFRAMDEAWRYKAHDLLRKQVKAVEESTAVVIDLKIDIGYPMVFNDETLTAKAWLLADEFAGKENVTETELRLGAEDFGYYTHHVPGCFFRLGAGNKAKGITSNVHTPTFNIDENAIEKGMGMMAWLGVHV
jgi:hippurate hydrolase